MKSHDAFDDDRCQVYRITCLPTGKIYFGVTRKTLARRWFFHVKDAKAKDGRVSVLWRAIRKYGAENFVIEQVCEAANGHEAQAVERALIAEHNTLAPNGMNASMGGEGHAGYRLTESAKEKISRANTGRKMTAEQKATISAARRGRKHSEEAKAKMRAAMADPEVRARRTAALHRCRNDPQVIAKRIAAVKKNWTDQAFRLRHAEGSRIFNEKRRASAAIEAALKATLEPRKRTKHEAMLDRWKDAEYRERMTKTLAAVVASDKTKAAQIASNKARAGNKRPESAVRAHIMYMKSVWSDPVGRARMMEKKLRKKDERLFGPSTAAVRALSRSLPAEYVPRLTGTS